jgi:hypothetical protein
MKEKMLKISISVMLATFILGFILIFSSYSIGQKMGDAAIVKEGGFMDTNKYERIIDTNTSNFKITGIILSSLGGVGLIVSGYVFYKEL